MYSMSFDICNSITNTHTPLCPCGKEEDVGVRVAGDVESRNAKTLFGSFLPEIFTLPSSSLRDHGCH
jgi:hypothetical protein